MPKEPQKKVSVTFNMTMNKRESHKVAETYLRDQLEGDAYIGKVKLTSVEINNITS